MYNHSRVILVSSIKVDLSLLYTVDPQYLKPRQPWIPHYLILKLVYFPLVAVAQSSTVRKRYMY